MQIPKHLGKSGRQFYKDMIADYSIDDAAGLALVTRAAECLDRIAAAQAAIKNKGEVVTDRYGQIKVNPACTLEKDSRNGFLLCMKALNLDIQPPGEIGRPAGD